MPFCNDFLQNAAKPIDVKSVAGDFEIAKKYIQNAVKEIAKAAPVKAADVDIYIHGSYANNTNIFFPSNLEICVELKIEPIKNYVLNDNYFISHNLEFTPKQFRALLYDTLSHITMQQCAEDDKCIILPQFGSLRHIVEITPCFSFDYVESDGAIFRGVLLHDAAAQADIVTFPKLHATNGNTKDVICEGNFKRMVRVFKTLNAVCSRENGTDLERGYFIECLLFNLPDSMFRGSTLDEIFLKILNYLLHANFSNYVCQNLVWQLFSAAREFWTEQDAHKFVQRIKRLFRTFPSTRTLLAE